MGKFSSLDFVAVVRDVFKEELERKKIDPRAMLFAANDITNFVEPPPFRHSVNTSKHLRKIHIRDIKKKAMQRVLRAFFTPLS